MRLTVGDIASCERIVYDAAVQARDVSLLWKRFISHAGLMIQVFYEKTKVRTPETKRSS